jgi:hypothetical protein
MAIAFHCQCGKKFTAERDCVGMQGRCDRCRRKFVVPTMSAEDTMLALTESWEAPVVDSQEHAKGTTAPASSPAWRDPIIVYSAGPAILVLLLFFAFVAGSNFPRESRPQSVQALTPVLASKATIPDVAPKPPIPSPSIEAKQDSRKNITVYLADSGPEFHANGCGRLTPSNRSAISLFDADQKHVPCRECWPSNLDFRVTVAAATPATPAPVVESVASFEPRSSSSSPRTREAAAAPSYSGSSSLGTTPTGLQLHMGPRGGIFHYSKNGNKVYQRRKK